MKSNTTPSHDRSFRDWALDIGVLTLAKKLRCTRRNVDYWLQGKSTPKVKTAKAIIKISKGEMTLEKIFASKK